MEANNILFRCSSLGHLMTDPRSKSELISETTKAYLIDVYVNHKYGRKQDITNKYITKGLMVEEDSITLYSLHNREFFKKNEEHLSNFFIKGTPDLYIGSSIDKAELIIDVKSSWDIFSFFRVTTQPLNKMYYWQLHGYMALTGAKKAKLVYCLVNTPESLINDEKRKLHWKMGLIDTSKDYEKACEEINLLSKYDDIAISERIIEFEIERNDNDIERLYNRITDCREWMNQNLFKTKKIAA